MHLHPVDGDGGGVAQAGKLGGPLLADLQPGPDRLHHVGPRTQVGLAVLGVDDHRVALRNPVAQPGQAADAGDVERAGDDGRVVGGRALLQEDALQLGAVVFEQVRGPEVAGDQDGVLRQHARGVPVA